MAWVVGETSVGPPSGVDPVGTMRLRISNNKQQQQPHLLIGLLRKIVLSQGNWCNRLFGEGTAALAFFIICFLTVITEH